MKHLILHSAEFIRLHHEFDIFIQTKGYGNGKIVSYPGHIKEFLFFMESKGLTGIKQVRTAEVIDYYEYVTKRPKLKQKGILSDSMIRHHLFSLRLFFDYLLDTDQVINSPARLPKFQVGKYRERNICTLEEIRQLYVACRNRRDKALLSVAYGCGLRRTEIQNLNTCDIDMEKAVLVVRAGKGNRSRTLPVSDRVLNDVREYIVNERATYFKRRQMESSPAFFIGNTGRRLKGHYINLKLKEIIKQTGNSELEGKKITLHCMRHSIATHLLDKGANIEFVQRFLGHSLPDTTHLYSKRRKQRLKWRH